MDNNYISKALRVAAEQYNGQTRKGKDVPYIVHPVEVAMILQKNGMNDEIIAAGLLHDVLEDGNITEDELKEIFNKRIVELVKAASEELDDRDNQLWKKRKEHTIKYLKNEKDLEIKYLACADKLSNIKSMYMDYQQIGEKLWDRFNNKDIEIDGSVYTREEKKEKQNWYYENLVDSLSDLKGNDIYEEFKYFVVKLFN